MRGRMWCYSPHIIWNAWFGIQLKIKTIYQTKYDKKDDCNILFFFFPMQEKLHLHTTKITLLYWKKIWWALSKSWWYQLPFRQFLLNSKSSPNPCLFLIWVLLIPPCVTAYFKFFISLLFAWSSWITIFIDVFCKTANVFWFGPSSICK